METLLYLTTVPLLAAVTSLIFPIPRFTRLAVPLLVWLQLVIVSCTCTPLFLSTTSLIELSSDFSLDRTSALFLMLTTVVVACALSHTPVFFEKEDGESQHPKYHHERIFYASSALFLLAMTLVFLCDNLGFLWISIEATTLASAPLVYYARTKHSLEATWKYFIICSVGIAFALLGTVLIFASSQHGALSTGSINLRDLIASAGSLQYPLLRLGYIFCFLGYGTKAGLFPLHSWLPDAHSEAPAPASAMLSGALLNCALFAIWRLSELVTASQHGALAYDLAVGLGTITTVAASLFLVRQHGIKRLWAYSSIENVGLMLVAIGMASPALFFLQALNHSLSKVSLFLLSGNIIQATGTKSLTEIRGLLGISPAWAMLLAASAFAVTGAPPFGAFISEWLILAHSADARQWLVLAALVFALALSFIAVSVHLGRVLLGTPKPNAMAFRPVATSLVPALLVASTLIAGITSLPTYLVTFK